MSQPRLPQGFSPDAGDVPAACALSPLEERRYLIGGKLLSWPGPMQTVTSPIYVGNAPAVLGSCPELTEAESLAAVDAVSAAWDNGLRPRARPKTRNC